MSANSNSTRSKGDLRSILAEWNNFRCAEESTFCTDNNLEQSLNVLNEVMMRKSRASLRNRERDCINRSSALSNIGIRII